MSDESGNNAPEPNIATESPKGAGVKFPPPLVFLLCLLAGSGMQFQFPLSLGISRPMNFLGLLFVLAAFIILGMCWLAFRRANTAIEPWKPTTSILYSGCYGFSRNPIYLSFCMCLLGIGIFADSLWIVLSCFPCGGAIYLLAIKKEEAYLERTFGAEYQDYKLRVRRWV